MKKQFLFFLTITFGVLFNLLFFIQISAQPDTLAVEKVTGNIWMLRQNSAGNVGVFTSNDGFIIVDDQFRTDSEKVREGLAKIAKLPVKYIINTHWHADHSEGNENFARTGSVIVAHENSRQRLTTDQFVELFQMLHAARPWEGLPSVTFTQDFSFYERGETIHVFHAPNAHTDGDAIVHFQTSNVFHMGDLVIWWGLPFIDDQHGGSVNGIIAAVERVIPLCNDETRIIPGHGKAGTKQDLLDYLQMLKAVREKVAKGVEQGKTLEQIIAEKPAGSFFSFISPDEFVKVAWRGLQKERE
jgi:glyoxylase-like metal-dependent hydrolase (beta-lactamase superfamily II)